MFTGVERSMATVDLTALGLSAEALIARKEGLGGSDANIIMGGNDERILRLWREKRGEAEPEDLTGNLAVMMGSYTEDFNAAWFEKQTGLTVIDRGIVTSCHAHDFMRCTLDGKVVTPNDPAAPTVHGVWEAKHCGSFGSDSELFTRYVPQLTHNCICTGLRRAWLSIFRGNADWVLFEYALDPAYAEQLVIAESNFWASVIYGTPPVQLPEPEAPVPLPVGVVEVDMAASNMWAHFAGSFIETDLAASWHEEAKEGLKDLMPDEATRAFGHGVQIKRDKRGSLRISIDKGD